MKKPALFGLVIMFLTASHAYAFRTIYQKKLLKKDTVYTVKCTKKEHGHLAKVEGWFEIGKIKGKVDGQYTDVHAKVNGKLEVKTDFAGNFDKEEYEGEYAASFDNVDDDAEHEVRLETRAVKVTIVLFEKGTQAFVETKDGEGHSDECEIKED